MPIIEDKSFRFLDLGQEEPVNTVAVVHKELLPVSPVPVVNVPKLDLSAPLSGHYVLRATTKATIRIPDMNLVFRKPRDYYDIDKIINKYGESFAKKLPVIKKLMDNNLIEIVPLKDAIEKAEKWEEEKIILAKKISKNSIVVNGSVDSVVSDGGSTIYIPLTQTLQDGGPIEIDIGNDYSLGSSPQNESEMPF